MEYDFDSAKVQVDKDLKDLRQANKNDALHYPLG
jgi:hypothetical protein